MLLNHKSTLIDVFTFSDSRRLLSFQKLRGVLLREIWVIVLDPIDIDDFLRSLAAFFLIVQLLLFVVYALLSRLFLE